MRTERNLLIFSNLSHREYYSRNICVSDPAKIRNTSLELSECVSETGLEVLGTFSEGRTVKHRVKQYKLSRKHSAPFLYFPLPFAFLFLRVFFAQLNIDIDRLLAGVSERLILSFALNPLTVPAYFADSHFPFPFSNLFVSLSMLLTLFERRHLHLHSHHDGRPSPESRRMLLFACLAKKLSPRQHRHHHCQCCQRQPFECGPRSST